MNDVIVKVTPQPSAAGVPWFHAQASLNCFAETAELAARLAGARALACQINEVSAAAHTTSTPSRCYYLVSKKPAQPGAKKS